MLRGHGGMARWQVLIWGRLVVNWILEKFFATFNTTPVTRPIVSSLVLSPGESFLSSSRFRLKSPMDVAHHFHRVIADILCNQLVGYLYQFCA